VILVDTSIWIDHFRGSNSELARHLDQGKVLIHPFIIGELALGYLTDRDRILAALNDLPRALAATDEEVLILINNGKLFGLGIGYIDAHLLAATKLTAAASLWTRDQKLHSAATKLQIQYT
jgi:predicted nucleic acid-binding protein